MDRVRHAGIALLVLASSAAHADHEHHAPAEASSTITASIGALAATYDSRLYEGDYQGISLGVAYARGRFEIAARAVAYQIDRNGKTYRGAGDSMVHGTVRIWERAGLATGAHLMVMTPTGDAMKGLGMGHWMLMPAGWVSYANAVVVLSGSLGYARGLGGEDAHAEHGGGGAWPLVEPMSFSEITYDATAMFALTQSLALGVRLVGAMPLEDDMRAIGGARISWRAGRIETLAELQTGIAGDPVKLRGLLSASITF